MWFKIGTQYEFEVSKNGRFSNVPLLGYTKWGPFINFDLFPRTDFDQIFTDDTFGQKKSPYQKWVPLLPIYGYPCAVMTKKVDF